MKTTAKLRCGLVLLVLLLSLLPLAAKDWTAADIPMVHLEDARRYVCDPEGLLSPALRDSTDSYLMRLEKERGVQSVFVIVNHVQNADVFRVAQDIGNSQGVGFKETNRGLVVVVAVQDRKYFIAPGTGLEGELTDMACGEIGRACIVQNMRAGNLDQAMLTTAKAVYNKVLTGKSGVEEDELDDGFFLILFLFMVILMAFVFWGGFDRLLRWFLGLFGITLPERPRHTTTRAGRPPFIILDDFHDFGSHSGGGFGGGGFGGGSFGGGSFGGGGAGGGW